MGPQRYQVLVVLIAEDRYFLIVGIPLLVIGMGDVQGVSLLWLAEVDHVPFGIVRS